MYVWLIWHNTWDDWDRRITELECIYSSEEKAKEFIKQNPYLYSVEKVEVK